MHRATPGPPALRAARLVAPPSLSGRLRLAGLCGALTLGAAVLAQRLEPGRRPLDVLGVLLLCAAAAFLVGGHWPVLRAAASGLAAAAYVASGYPSAIEALAPAVALVAAVLTGTVRHAAPVAVGVVLAAVAASRLGPEPIGVTGAVVALALAVALVAFADALRMRVRVETARSKYAEHGRLKRLADERVRIVRDVHGHVGAELAAMSRRARLARHLIDTYDHRAPAETRTALEDLTTRGADALDELRVVTALLDGEAPEALPRTPPRGLAGLPEALMAHIDTGLHVVLSGDPGRLPRAVDRCAYEVVVTALDNVARHSVAVRAEVVLGVEREPGGDVLVVRVHDGGPARPARALPRGVGSPPGGLGDVRARATLLGGQLHAAPDGAGGWLVRASLPLPG